MNLVNSKIIKSSRPIINRSVQTISAYSCELYIQSFKISHRGFVYFVWNSNSSQIQSLRYESNGRLVQVKETLTLSLRIVSKNGKDISTSTSLKLIAEGGEELDQFQIIMNNLTSQFKQMQIPMDRGLVNVKIRRKAMNIGQDQDLNIERGFYRSIAQRIQQKSMTHVITGQYESLQEELGRTKKELEDAVYLNNKLKNDRDVLMATKQQLQLQIQTMIIQITKQVSILRQHYDNRMSIRQHCYEQQIEDMVNLFNSTADQNKKTLQVILRQKIKLQDEIKPLNERLKFLQQQIIHKNEQYGRLQKLKFQMQLQISRIQQSNFQKDKQIQILNSNKNKLQQNINVLNLKLQHLNYDINNYRQQNNKLQSNIKQLINRLQNEQKSLKQKDRIIIQQQQKLNNIKQKQISYINQKQLLLKQIQLLQDNKNKYINQINLLKNKLQQYQYQMEFNQNVMGQLKKQHQQKQQQLYLQLQSLQKLYSQKMQQIISNFNLQKQTLISSNQQLQSQKQQLINKIKSLQNNYQGSQIKINQLDTQLNNLNHKIKSNQTTTQQKDLRIQALQTQLQRIKNQINKIPILQKKKSQPKFDIIQTQNKNNILQSMNKQLINKNKQLQNQIKRLIQQIQKIQKQKIKNQQDKKSKSKHSQKNSRSKVQDLQNFGTGPFNRQQVRQIVIEKQRQISELRRRVDYLQNLYDGMKVKLEEIATKYPQIDLGLQAIPKPHQWCDSQQQQQKLLNHQLFHKFSQKDPTSPLPTAPKKQFSMARKNSIGAIIQKDQDILSNPSAKLPAQRRSYQPRSEKRIADDYKQGVLRRQSLQKVRIQVPKGGLKRQGSHGSYDPSQRSGSYIKVSHSKKIRELEEQNKNLYQRLKQYQGQIDQQSKNMNMLRQEIQKKTTEKPLIPPKLQIAKQSKQSQVFIEDERLKNFMHQSQLKQFQIQKMNLRMGQLEDNIKNQRNQALKKINFLELRITEGDKRYEEISKRFQGINEMNKNLQKLLQQSQQKLRKQKQISQQVRLKTKQLQMHLDNSQNQLKKINLQKQNLQQKIQKLIGSQAVIKQLSKEIDDLNKKALDQTRTINHLKLEKDAIQQQLRLIKKRQNDHIRTSTQWQQKAASLERAIQQQKRKQGKFKRQIEQAQQQLRRAKFNTKKAQQQLQVLSSAQATWQAQRRKHLDQISNLQDQLSRKDYQYGKINKQLQKWKMRAQQKQQMRIGKKSELRQQIDRLQSELIRRQKRILQQTQQNKLLRGRIEHLQRDNKRIMQQKNQSYGQKLKYYVQQMSNIKKLLQQYQNQNSRLKIDNNQLYEQLQILRMNFDKLQMKYDENIERQQNILTDLQAYMNEVNILKDRLVQAHGQIDQAQGAFVSLRKQSDENKLRQRKTIQKFEISERNLQRAMIQIRDLKIKISQFQTNNEINGKMAQRYRLLQRKKNELQEQYRKLKSQYDNIINIFIFKRQDLQKAASQARNQQKRLRQQQVQRISQQCLKTITSKTQRLQQQILDLYNQNSRSRAEIQTLLQENGRQKGRLSELEIMNQRFVGMQDENQAYKTMIQQLKEQVRKKLEKISKLQLSIQGIQAEFNTQNRQLIANKNRIKDLQKIIQQLNNQISLKKASQRQLQDAILRATQTKNRQKSQQDYLMKQRQNQLIQQYQSKIHGFEMQIQKLKDKQARSIQQNALKMKNLQKKMDQMQQALKQRQKAIQGHYESQMQQLQNSLLHISQQLQQKLIRIDELNQAIIILQGQNKDLSKQIQQIKIQSQQQRQILQTQLNRLKNKFKQAQNTYAANMKSLQQQILRNAQKGNISGSRLKGNQQQRIIKRYEDKLKTKDRKIQQLKQNIYTLQQTIVRLKKKQNVYQTTLNQIQRLKLSMIEIQKQRKILQNKYQQQLNINNDTIRQLKRQLLICKQNQDRLRLISQQKNFEIQSISCQLKTMRQLYTQLQKQLEKRKNNLTLQLQQQSNLQFQLRNKQNKLIQIQQKLIQLIKNNKDLEIDLKKKIIQNKKYIQIINQNQRKQQINIQDINKLTNQLNITKKSLYQLNTNTEFSKTQVSKIRTELTRLRKNHEELRSTSIAKEEAANQIKKLYDELTIRYRESQQLSRRYTIINERFREHLGYGIQQAIDQFLNYMQQKDSEVNQLLEQVEQLKFLNQRKYLDYDQLKKQNFQLQIKAQDLDILNDQLQALRKICDKLEEQKKNSVFREQVLRMQLQNLAKNGNSDLRSRIQAILSNPSVPSFANFSFY